jgi:hypothetical protein
LLSADQPCAERRAEEEASMKFATDRVAALGLCFIAAGCSSLSDEAAETLVSTPGRYEFFDCKQLENERISLTSQMRDLRTRMEKYETGFAGSVVNETVYQTDYINLRANLKRADDAWQTLKCVPTPPKGNPAAKSTGGVY